MAASLQHTGIILSISPMDGFSYLDLGQSLADTLQSENLSSPALPFKAYDAIKAILSDNQQSTEEGIAYIAIKNLNILFEPALKINVRSLVEDYAKRCLLVLQINNRLTRDGVYYPFPNNTTYSLELGSFPVPIQER